MGSMCHREVQQTIIIPATDIVSEFINSTNTIFTSKKDIDELMFQVINTLVSPDNENNATLEPFPDISRLWNTNTCNNEHINKEIQIASIKLQVLVKQRLIDYGVYEDSNFSYFFLRFIGYDLILSYLPH